MLALSPKGKWPISRRLSLRILKSSSRSRLMPISRHQHIRRRAKKESSWSLGLLGKPAPAYVALPALPVTRENLLDAWKTIYHTEAPVSVKERMKELGSR